MIITRLFALIPLLFIGIALPTVAAPESVAPAAPEACVDVTAFISALSDAGDWIIKRDPDAASGKLARVAFRELGMINVAVFKDGCLAMVVVVGQAKPDITV